MADGRKPRGQPVGIAVEAKRRFQRSKPDLVEPHRTLERMFGTAPDQIAPPDDEAGLRTAEQLVAGERHQIGAVAKCILHRALTVQAIARQIDQRSRAEVVDKGQFGLRCDRSDLARRHLGGKALNRVIRHMHFHQQRGLRADRLTVVVRMRTVGGADFAQDGSGALHDRRHAKRAADFDQFAARNDGLLAGSERGQHQQRRGGIVVDDDRVFGGGQFADQRSHVIVAFAAAAGLDIELERSGAGHGLICSGDRFISQDRAAEIGVKHDARQVEYRPHRRQVFRLKSLEDLRADGVRGWDVDCAIARLTAENSQPAPDSGGRGRSAEARDDDRAGVAAQHLVNGRNIG